MGRGAKAAFVAALVLGVGLAGLASAGGKGAKPVVVTAGNMVLKLNGDVVPRTLPRNRPAPIGVWGSGTLKTLDGSHPPALQSGVFDADKDVFVSVKGLPACKIGQLEARETKKVEAVCRDAILGHGSATVEVAFPEQAPIVSKGPLVLFNGGERGGAVTVYAHAYVKVPAPTAVVATVRITRVDKGSLGLHIEFQVPRIAGGAGSTVAARFNMHRAYTYKGKRRSVLSARCPDGRILGRGTFGYSDGTTLSGSILRPCTASD